MALARGLMSLCHKRSLLLLWVLNDLLH